MQSMTGYTDPKATAERIAVALVMGKVPADLIEQARAELAQANRAVQVEADAQALRAYRAGEMVQAWPAVAPWAGF